MHEDEYTAFENKLLAKGRMDRTEHMNSGMRTEMRSASSTSRIVAAQRRSAVSTNMIKNVFSVELDLLTSYVGDACAEKQAYRACRQSFKLLGIHQEIVLAESQDHSRLIPILLQLFASIHTIHICLIQAPVITHATGKGRHRLLAHIRQEITEIIRDFIAIAITRLEPPAPGAHSMQTNPNHQQGPVRQKSITRPPPPRSRCSLECATSAALLRLGIP